MALVGGGGSPPAVLCINLKSATRRWDSIERQVPRFLPGPGRRRPSPPPRPRCPLHRIDAVSWRDLGTVSLPLTLWTRYLLEVPDSQARHRCSHRQIDSLSSVAIILSHIRCWEWLQKQPPHVTCALILEDDACFDPAEFGAAWTRHILPACADPRSWDCLVLGYFAPVGPAQPAPLTPPPSSAGATASPSPWVRYNQFFGAHAYLVTRSGAATLLRHAHPIDHQTDGLLATCSELGLLRLHMLPRSAVSQCLDGVDRDGSFHTHTVMESPTGAATLTATTTTTTLTTSNDSAGGGGGSATLAAPWIVVLVLAVVLLLVLAARAAWRQQIEKGALAEG